MSVKIKYKSFDYSNNKFNYEKNINLDLRKCKESDFKGISLTKFKSLRKTAGHIYYCVENSNKLKL